MTLELQRGGKPPRIFQCTDPIHCKAPSYKAG
jgi:hypothetical protein